jgi:hypothetical protein
MDQERRIQAAIAALSDGSVPTVLSASKIFNIPRSTLKDRLKGRPSAKARQQARQRLTTQEEDAIVKSIHTLTTWGWPMSIHWLESFTTSLLKKKGDDSPLGHNWYLRFLTRHPELRTKWSRCMDQQRKDASEYETVDKWFQLFQATCLQYGVCSEDIYNMDEKGFMKGIGEDAKVIIPRSEAQALSIQPGNKEWVTVIESIGTNGSIIPPFVIFEGKTIQQSWINRKMDPRMVIAVSENGWTSYSLAIDWIRHFDKYTKDQAKGQYRLLILDGHISHASLDFVKYCEDHRIIPICLPPYATHILQPFDVSVFGPLSQAYKRIVREQSLFGTQRVTNEDFLTFFQLVRPSISRNIQSAFRKTGLYPFNPSVVLQQLRPKTPPKASFTDENGVTIDIVATENDLATRINDIVA